MRDWYNSENVNPASCTEFWDLCHKREQYRTAYKHYWMSTRDMTALRRTVDGVIMPVAPVVGVQEGQVSYHGTKCHLRRLFLSLDQPLTQKL